MTSVTRVEGEHTMNMEALAYLYDHLKDLPQWIQRLTPEQMQQLASVLAHWQARELETNDVLPLDKVEKREFTRALTVFEGDVCAAAKALGIGKTTAYRRLKQWGITGSDCTGDLSSCSS